MRVKESELKIGDWVHMELVPQGYQKRSPKCQQMYTGPHLIVRLIAPVNFVLQKSQRSKPFLTHADKLLKKCYSQTPVNWLTISNRDEDVGAPELSKVECDPPSTAVEMSSSQSDVRAPIRRQPKLTSLTHSDDIDLMTDILKDRPHMHNLNMPKKFADYY